MDVKFDSACFECWLCLSILFWLDLIRRRHAGNNLRSYYSQMQYAILASHFFPTYKKIKQKTSSTTSIFGARHGNFYPYCSWFFPKWLFVLQKLFGYPDSSQVPIPTLLPAFSTLILLHMVKTDLV